MHGLVLGRFVAATAIAILVSACGGSPLDSGNAADLGSPDLLLEGADVGPPVESGAPPPDSGAPPDTLVTPDSTSPPDSLVPPDTFVPPPDSTTPADTFTPPPDTFVPPPDSTTPADTFVPPDTSVEDSSEPTDPGKPPVVQGNAKSCSKSAECASGHCVDGVCCDSPCTDRCHSCALPQSPGHCTLQPTGYDLRGECGTAASCTSTCGPGGACIPAFAGARCAESTCTDSSHGRGPAVCSGAMGACKTEDAIEFDCAPYACQPAFGACLSSCVASDQCAAGFVCDTSSQHCVAGPGTADDGGCGCATPGHVSRGLGAACALAIALGTLARRRRSLSR